MLKAKWEEIFGDSAKAERAFEALVKLYRNRFYHNLDHIETMLRKNIYKNNTSLILSIIFHDVICNSRALAKGVNEQNSARYLQRVGKEFGLDKVLLEVVSYTITHTEEDNYFNALDFSILGAEAKEYDRYSKQIREEYSWVDPMVYRRERIKVLTSLMTRRFSYSIEGCGWAQAKLNMQREIYFLENNLV